MQDRQQGKLVFCTASNESAGENDEVNVCYYLHKPFGVERVRAMLDRLNLEKAEEARTVRLPDVCKEETAEDRKIVIRAGTEGGPFCITVDNTYSGTLHYTKGGVPASTKHKGAGLSIRPIRSIAERCGGVCRLEAKDGMFYASVYCRTDAPLLRE